MRAAFVRTLIELAQEDERIFLLVGDVGYSLVEPFAEKFPKRFLNTGIAEQNMAGIAAGLALCDKVVFVYSLANFPTIRCLEQIRIDICYHNVNVNIVASGGGLTYGTLGYSHHVTEDMAVMRALPNMTIITPGDPIEAALATAAVGQHPGPCYLRLVRTGDPVVHQTPPAFQIGKAIELRTGNDITLISIGGILPNVMQAASQLSSRGIESRVLSMHTLKPLDTDAIMRAVRETKAVVTIEEHSKIGGLGSAVSEVLAEYNQFRVPFRRIGIDDTISQEVGNQEYLQRLFSLSTGDIASAAESLIKT